MEALAVVLHLTAITLSIGQLIVPKDITVGQQASLNQLDFINADPTRILHPHGISMNTLSWGDITAKENHKQGVTHSRFPVTQHSDIPTVTKSHSTVDVHNKIPLDVITEAPLPIGVDFLSTSVSSQQLRGLSLHKDRKSPDLMSPSVSQSHWKNLVKTNPRQVGDRFDIVVGKHSQTITSDVTKKKIVENASKKENSTLNKDNTIIHKLQENTANTIVDNAALHKTQLQSPNTPVESITLPPWLENNKISSHFTQTKMSELSTPEVKVERIDLNSKQKLSTNSSANHPSSHNNQHNGVTVDIMEQSKSPQFADAEKTFPNDNALTSMVFHAHIPVENIDLPNSISPWDKTTWFDPPSFDTKEPPVPSWTSIANGNPSESAPNHEALSTGSTNEIAGIKMTENFSDSKMNSLSAGIPVETELQKSGSAGFFATWNPWSSIQKTTSSFENVHFETTKAPVNEIPGSLNFGKSTLSQETTTLPTTIKSDILSKKVTVSTGIQEVKKDNSTRTVPIKHATESMLNADVDTKTNPFVEEKSTLPPFFEQDLLPPWLSDVVEPQVRKESISTVSIGGSSSITTDNPIHGDLTSPPAHQSQTTMMPSLVSTGPPDLIPPPDNLHIDISHPIEPHVPHISLPKEQPMSTNSMKSSESLLSSIGSHSHSDLNQKVATDVLSGQNANQLDVKIGLQKEIRNTPLSGSKINEKGRKSGESRLLHDNHRNKLVLPTIPHHQKSEIIKALMHLNEGNNDMTTHSEMIDQSKDNGMIHAFVGGMGEMAIGTNINPHMVNTFSVGGLEGQVHVRSETMKEATNNLPDKPQMKENIRFGQNHASRNNLTPIHANIHDANIHNPLKSTTPDRRNMNEIDMTNHVNHFAGNEFSPIHEVNLDLSQDLTKTSLFKHADPKQKVHMRMENENTGTAKLRFFKTKSTKNILEIQKRKEEIATEPSSKNEFLDNPFWLPVTTQSPPVTSEDTLYNNNSVFYDPDTQTHINPFNKIPKQVLKRAENTWTKAVSSVKKHIDPIPEIAAVVGDKTNAVRTGSVSSFRIGRLPVSSPMASDAALYFRDPVTDAIVHVDAAAKPPPEKEKKETNQIKPPVAIFPAFNSQFSNADVEGNGDSFFIGPVLFGPVDNVPPSGDIEISGPVLARALPHSADSKHGLVNIRKGLLSLLNNLKHSKSAANSHTPSPRHPFVATSAGRMEMLSKLRQAAEQKALKRTLKRNHVNPLQKILHTNHQKIDKARLSSQTSSSVDLSTDISSGKQLSKKLREAIEKILKANERKAIIKKNRGDITFHSPRFSAVNRIDKKMVGGSAQHGSRSAINKKLLDILKLAKARRNLFQTKQRESPLTKSRINLSRNRIESSVFRKPAQVLKQRQIDQLKSILSRKAINDWIAKRRRNKLLKDILRSRYLKNNVIRNDRSYQPRYTRPAARSSLNNERHMMNTHTASAMRPIPISSLPSLRFSPPSSRQDQASAAYQFLIRNKIWPTQHIHEQGLH